MNTSLYDKKAVEILLNYFLYPRGCKTARPVSPDEIAYARSQGVMFELETFYHDASMQAARALAEAVGSEAVARAFVASLSTREAAYRSALGSFATARWLPPHAHAEGRSYRICKVCGHRAEEDLTGRNILNFARLMSGGGGASHLHPDYACFDLAEFQKLPPAQPTAADYDILKRILDCAASQLAGATANNLKKAITGLFPSNKEERQVVLQILGYCGILQPAGHPTFFQSYANLDDRKEPSGDNEWEFPVLWWRGRDGINAKALAFYFPNL